MVPWTVLDEKVQKELNIIKELYEAELISYLDTIQDTTTCKDTKKYIEVVKFRRGWEKENKRKGVK